MLMEGIWDFTLYYSMRKNTVAVERPVTHSLSHFSSLSLCGQHETVLTSNMT